MKGAMWGIIIILVVCIIFFVISLIYEHHHKDDLWVYRTFPWSGILIFPILGCILVLLLIPIYQEAQTEFENRIAEGYTVYYEGIEVSSDSIHNISGYSVFFDDESKTIIINDSWIQKRTW